MLSTRSGDWLFINCFPVAGSQAWDLKISLLETKPRVLGELSEGFITEPHP